jgi:hypothetical protein
VGLTQIHTLGHTGQYFSQCQLNFGLQIVAGRSAAASSTGAPSPAPEKALEKIGKLISAATASAAGILLKIPWPGKPLTPSLLTGFLKRLCLIPLSPELIIFLPFLRISKNFLCLIQLFKFFLHLGLLWARMKIGMVLAGKAAKGLLDVVGRGGSGNAENLIVIAWGRGHT